MHLRVTVHPPFRPPMSSLTKEGRDCCIGRGPECDLVVDDERVSRRHAVLRWRCPDWWLVDLGSKNGTAVEGRPLGAEGETRITEDCWVSLGGLQARIALTTAEAEAATSRRRLERWHSAVELQQRLDPSLGLGELLARVLDSVLRLSGTERGFVLLDDGAGALRVEASQGLEEADLEDSAFSGSVGALSRALEERRVVVVSSVADSSQFNTRPSVVARGIESLVCVPLLLGGHCKGVIYGDSRRAGGTFEELDVGILEALAAHAVLGIEIARVGDDLRRLTRALAVSTVPGARSLRSDLQALLGRTTGAVEPEAPPAPSPRVVTTWDTLRRRHTQAGRSALEGG